MWVILLKLVFFSFKIDFFSINYNIFSIYFILLMITIFLWLFGRVSEIFCIFISIILNQIYFSLKHKKFCISAFFQKIILKLKFWIFFFYIVKNIFSMIYFFSYYNYLKKVLIILPFACSYNSFNRAYLFY